MNKLNAVPGRPTMQEVATLAGVSKITVSRALRGSELVRPEVRDRIVKIAREAGYRMNAAARNLRTQRTQTIAVVMEQVASSERPISDPLLLWMVGGLIEVLTPADYALLLTTSDHFLASTAIDADGVVVIGQGEDGRRLEEVQGVGLPTVGWGVPLPGSRVPVIGSDNRLGGQLVARHLVDDCGCRKLLFLGDIRHPEIMARFEGVRDVLSSTPAALAGRMACGFSAKGGAQAVATALTDGIAFDGVVAVSDFIAAGACEELDRHRLRVPNDVAVVGFDDNAIASTHRPSLSSIRQDWNAAGHALGHAILAALKREAPPGASPPLQVELIVRQSSSR
ncbi:LacI family DNA-binding transcriptional regulator [uncultured Sphingomonas sp.]|uniref:LacI family DNA-binding transcriptional regulator n=1 Tax=uncultured Sphingomonas sp. TaxID=158754 RepID=UPI0035CC87B6